MLLKPAQMMEYFPDIKTEKGLPYVEPAALEITALMTQLRSVLFEYKTLVDLEQKSTGAISSGSKPPIADPKPYLKTKNSKEPTRPPSIRHKGNKPPTSIISSSAVKLPESKNIKRSYETQAGYSPPVNNSRKRNATTTLSKSISSDGSDVGYNEESLMLKTKENLLALCNNLQIDISRSSKKDVIISAIMHRKDRSKHVLPSRERIELHATDSRVTEIPTLRSAGLGEFTSNVITQNNIAANIGKVMDGIESRLSNNLTSCVSETRKQSTMLQEELIATKATLAAERQQKKEYKKEATETLNEHVEIFGEISDAATKPLMEVMRLFTQNTMAAVEKSSTSASAKTDFPPQQPTVPSAPTILHNYHQHQHHPVLPSSAYAPLLPSVEQVMIHSYPNQQMVNNDNDYHHHILFVFVYK